MFNSSLMRSAWLLKNIAEFTTYQLPTLGITTWYLGIVPSPQYCQHFIGFQEWVRVQQAKAGREAMFHLSQHLLQIFQDHVGYSVHWLM